MADARFSRTMQYCLGAAIAGRVLFPWLFGLLDNDGVILLAAARRQAMAGGWSTNSPLAVWLTSICFRLFDVELWAARLVPMLAGVGAVALVHRQASADGDERAGWFAALLLAAMPIAVFYSCADVPYALLTFLGLLGLWLLARAASGEGVWLAAAAGLAWAGAFGCKTFAAVFVVPALAATAEGLWRRQRRAARAWLPPLLACGAWGVAAGALTWWRWRSLGWSVFYDFPTDFRFQLLTQSFLSHCWRDLVSVEAFAAPLLAPAVAIALARRERPVFERLGWWFVAADLGVYFLNPVHHMPRALLPSAPFFAYLAGRELARAMDDDRRAGFEAWALAAVGLLLWRLAPWAAIHAGGWTLLAEAAAALAVFFVGRGVSPGRTAAWRSGVGAALAAAVVLQGLAFAYRNLDAADRNYGAQLEALKFSGATVGVVGGGDAAEWASLGERCYPALMDLPEEALRRAARDGLPAAMRELRLSAAIVDRLDQENALTAFAAFAQAHGQAGPNAADPYRALDRDSRVWRAFDNGLFAAYRLDGLPPPETDAWPQWRLVEAPLDRTGLGLSHPTAVRLAIVDRPSPGALSTGGGERLVTAELTALPRAAAEFEIAVVAEGADGRPLWQTAQRRSLRASPLGVGVPLARIAVDRGPAGDAEAIVVPPEAAPVARLEIRATPLGGGQPSLWVTVRPPDGW